LRTAAWDTKKYLPKLSAHRIIRLAAISLRRGGRRDLSAVSEGKIEGAAGRALAGNTHDADRRRRPDEGEGKVVRQTRPVLRISIPFLLVWRPNPHFSDRRGRTERRKSALQFLKSGGPMKSFVTTFALATALGALASGSATAAAVPYQAQVLIGAFHCTSGWCTATFPAVPAGKTLTVNDTSCIFTVNGSFIDAQLQWNVGAVPYYFGLTSQWQRANGGNINGTFGSHATFTVAAGKKVQAVTQITGSLLGAHCEMFGTLN
jgi:hypothetical protein